MNYLMTGATWAGGESTAERVRRVNVKPMARSGTAMSDRVVVLGSAGFIGGSLVGELESQHMNVVGLSHLDVDAIDRVALSRPLGSGDVVINTVGYAAESLTAASTTYSRSLCISSFVEVLLATGAAEHD